MNNTKKLFVKKTFVYFFSTVFFVGAYAYYPQIINYIYAYKHEFFLNPVYPTASSFELRNDTMGDGHFGARRGGGTRTHTGIDIISEIGNPILSSAAGRVIWADTRGGYGKLIILQHPNDFYSYYAHLSEINVQLGEWVPQGRKIGASGKSGNAGSSRILPHIHFEIRQGSEPLDPLLLIFSKS